MKTLVTGCAGFIGSHLCEELLKAGHSVTGVDALTDYYDPLIKKSNIEHCRTWRTFRFLNCFVTDLTSEHIRDTDVIFHLAGQPGVRSSWGDQFQSYLNQNVLATQVLLEHAKRSSQLRRFIYTSSSSVYGNPHHDHIHEDHPKNPFSPYGVTKLAGEQLCMLFAGNYGVPAIALRLFTVFGPRQRPDMLIHRLITSGIAGSRFTLYGDGTQYRDFTYVGDVVGAMLTAATNQTDARIFNIAGGQVATVNDVISMVEDVIGTRIAVDRGKHSKGDVAGTRADISLATKELAYKPKWTLRDGILEEAHCIAERLVQTRSADLTADRVALFPSPLTQIH